MSEANTRRKRPTPTELLQENARLRREVAELGAIRKRFLTFAEAALPDEALRIYEGHRRCTTAEELAHVLRRVVNLLEDAAEPIPETYPGSRDVSGVRVKCPLCTAQARGPFMKVRPGWGYPKGLEGHLAGEMDASGGGGCGLMQMLRENAWAAFEQRHPGALS